MSIGGNAPQQSEQGAMHMKVRCWKHPVPIAWTQVKKYKISTIKMNGWNTENKYETFVTFPWGERSVVAHYKSAHKAHIGHLRLVDMYLHHKEDSER